MSSKNNIGQPVFFKPNTEMIKWILEYADDRLIIDAGCGEKFLLSQQLLLNGGKAIVSIDININQEEYMKFRALNLDKVLKASFHTSIGTMEEWKSLIQMDKEVLLIFARPCHSDWVEETISWKSDSVEVLYITLPENVEKYNDLGKFEERAVLLKHKGSSADKEVVYSIK